MKKFYIFEYDSSWMILLYSEGVDGHDKFWCSDKHDYEQV